jgi:CheY-like chemotaxis protein
VLRVYWHQFIARAEREWLGSQHEAGMWTLSRTSVDNDQLLHTSRHPLPQRTGLVAIHADSLITYECLAEMCGLGGWSAIWLAPRQPLHLQRTSILLWDMPAAVATDLDHWQTCHQQLRPTASIVLVGFPRQQDLQLLCEAGAASVLAKPLVIADLLNTLDRATRADGGKAADRQRRAG